MKTPKVSKTFSKKFETFHKKEFLHQQDTHTRKLLSIIFEHFQFCQNLILFDFFQAVCQVGTNFSEGHATQTHSNES